MKYIECPTRYSGNGISLFMAGGITGCSDWQRELAEKLKDEDIVIFNPRRKKFSVKDESITNEQILWEHNYLKKAHATSFWFTSETLCPITLFELGKQAVSNRPLFVGMHPNYARRKDVEIQLGLMRPDVRIVYDIESLADQIKGWRKSYSHNPG